MDQVGIIDSGPLPLTRAQGWWAALAVGLVGITIAVVLPVIARVTNAASVPPDAISFGPASLVQPLPEDQSGGTWRVEQGDGDSVQLSKGDVVLRATVRGADPDPAAALGTIAAETVGSDLPGAKPSKPVTFEDPTTLSQGIAQWWSGSRGTAVVALVPEFSGWSGGTALYAVVSAIGPRDQMRLLAPEIDDMVRSVRFSPDSASPAPTPPQGSASGGQAGGATQ